MKRNSAKALFILALLLGACTPTPYSAGPNTLRLAGEGAALDTQQARFERAAQATQNAAEIGLTYQTTANAFNLAAQQTAVALDLQGRYATMTVDAMNYQATQSAQATAQAQVATQTAVAFQATATAIVKDAAEAESQREFQSLIDMAWLLLPVCGLGGLVLVLLGFLWKASDYVLDVFERRASITSLPAGARIATWIVDEETGRLVPTLLGEAMNKPRLPYRTSNGDADGVTKLTPSGSVLMGPIPRHEVDPNSVHALTLALLLQAQQLYGSMGTTLPGWRHLGEEWNSEKWQRVIAALKAQDLVETSNNGTALKGATIGELVYKVETGKIKIRPAPVSPSPTPPAK